MIPVAAVLCVGHAVQDFVFTVDSFPDTAEKHRASDFAALGGGPAATAAATIARLGGDALLAARVGDDRIADIIVAELEAYAVDCSMVKRFAKRRSSVSAVIVDAAGERLIMNYLDPDLESQPDWLPNELPDNIDAVLADTRWPEGALHALTLARGKGVPGVLDADVPVPKDGSLVRAATHVAFSARGLADYCGNDDPLDALQAVAETTEAWCCVTLGREGTLYLSGGKAQYTKAFTVPVVDTLGAGDVWHGAFALALAERMHIDDAMTFAAAAAALKVANGKGRAGTPSRQAVDKFLQQNNTEKRA